MSKYLIARLGMDYAFPFYDCKPVLYPKGTQILIKYDEDERISILLFSPITKTTINISIEDAIIMSLELMAPYETFINDRLIFRDFTLRNPLFRHALTCIMFIMITLLSLPSCAPREIWYAQKAAIGTYSPADSSADTVTSTFK